jgi:glycosyltransferase involved in cell wall biosynthesis
MAEAIKILVDAHFVTAGYQGTQTFLAGLYNAMQRQYPDVGLYFATSNAVALKTVFPFADEQHIFVIKKRKPSLLRLRQDIPALLKKHAFDFAHFQYVAPAIKTACCMVVTTHDILFNDYPTQFSRFYRSSRNLLFGRSIRRACIKTTVSAYSQKRISKHYGIDENNISVLPNAVADNFGHNIEPEKAAALVNSRFGLKNFILYVSRIEPRKNHHLLLQKYLQLSLWKDGIALVFLGKKSIEVPAFEKLLQSLSAEQRSYIHFLSDVDVFLLEALYKSCRLFVYPSAAEGFGIPPLEAAVCGAPVLCSSATAMEDFTFFHPHVFNPADEAAFEAQLKTILASPPSAALLDETARAVRARYTWNTTAAVFYRILKERGGSGR